MNTHLLSVNVEKAKVRIKKLQNQIDELHSFVESAENYNPSSEGIEQQVIKEYAFLGSVLKTTDKLNKEGVKNWNGISYKTDDIVRIIDSKPADELHKHVRKIFRTNKKNANAKRQTY